MSHKFKPGTMAQEGWGMPTLFSPSLSRLRRPTAQVLPAYRLKRAPTPYSPRRFSHLTMRELLTNSSPLPQPDQVHVASRGVIVQMVIRRKSGNGPLIPPTVILRMPVGEACHTAAIMGAVGKVEKAVLRHIHAEVRPAETVGIDINKGERPGGQLRRDFTMLLEHRETGVQTGIPKIDPRAHVGVQGVTADPGER